MLFQLAYGVAASLSINSVADSSVANALFPHSFNLRVNNGDTNAVFNLNIKLQPFNKILIKLNDGDYLFHFHHAASYPKVKEMQGWSRIERNAIFRQVRAITSRTHTRLLVTYAYVLCKAC